MKNFSYIHLPVTVRWTMPYLRGEDTCRTATTHEDVAIDWRQLSTSKDSEQLGRASKAVLFSTSKSFVKTVKEQTQAELYVLATDAQKTADNFWSINKKMRLTGDPKLQGFFGTRARLVSNTLDAHWYRNRFVAKKGSSKKGVLSEHIAKGGGARYPSAVFKTAKPWEKDAINVVEARYELLRKRSAALSKIRRALAEYERLLNQCFPEP